MFAKLLKHEFKATWGQLGVLSLCALGAGGLGAVLLRMLQATANGDLHESLEGVLTMMMVFVILALVIYGVGTGFVLYHRFYKNKFTDEGYLTFTLPVRSWQILLASLINIAVWMVIVMLVVGISMAIITIFGLGDLLEEANAGITIQKAEYAPTWEAVLGQISGVVTFFSTIAMVQTCITLGSVWAKKHKLMAAVGIYYGISMLQSTISAFAMAAAMISNEDFVAAMEFTYWCNIVVNTLFGVGGFFLSAYLMDHKLNLP